MNFLRFARLPILQGPALFMVRACMKQVTYFNKIKAEFVKDNGKPENAYTGGKDGGQLDERRWNEITADSCLKKWNKVKSACTSYHNCVKRVEAIHLTGSPTSADVKRCTVVLYNDGCAVQSHFYGIIRNPKYWIGKAFPYDACYEFFSKNTPILECDGVPKSDNDDDDKGTLESPTAEGHKSQNNLFPDGPSGINENAVGDNVGSDKRPSRRPIGTKAAKSRKGGITCWWKLET